VIAIESGGSGTRIALAGPGGAFVRLERCASGSCLYRDPAGFASGFNEALGRVLAVTTAQRHTIRAVGMAGPMDEPLVRGLLNGALPGVPQYTYSEGEVARGLYGIRAGIALIAGTGCSCSAVDEAGVLTSFGGYGPQFGDEGSAYWIGQEGLKTAFLAEQGRIEPTALLDAARAFYDVASPWGIHEEAGGTGHVPAPRVAAFAAEVDRCARDCDCCAMHILDEAGAHLGQLILDTAARARLRTAPVPLVMTGGALRAPRVVSAIARKLATSPLQFTHYPIAHDPIGGLIRLLQDPNDSRTRENVS
jgi:glucosamine kinase